MQRLFVAAVTVAFAGLLVATGSAKNVGGTVGNDALRGTPAADVISGKAGDDTIAGLGGNDVLIGGGGNDKLTGGPGADTLNCGPGKDIAAADVLDRIRASCEVVTGLPAPALSVADASAVEGNSGTATLSFPITLSRAITKAVSVQYATADGTAGAPGDYAAARGTVTLQPGQKTASIEVSVVSDTVIEQDETLSIVLSAPINAAIAKGTAAGTIRNDDTAAPVSTGSWKGQTQNGNFVFFTVLPTRGITGFRINDLPAQCNGGVYLTGGPNFGGSVFVIRADGTFQDEGRWDGSDVDGDVEWTHWDAKIAGTFSTSTSATGTIVVNFELKWQGTAYRCSSGEIRWSATLQG